MEITRSNFKETLPIIEQTIKTCDFISIDTEFTGIDLPGHECSLFDNPQERYAKEKKAVEAFTLSQIGIACFTRNPDLNKYEAAVFNIPVFPSPIGKYNEMFMAKGAAFEFLCRHRFDFNKFIYDGVPFLSRQNADKLRSELEAGFIGQKDMDMSHFSNTCQLLTEWLSKADSGQTNEIDITDLVSDTQRLLFEYELLRTFPQIIIQKVDTIKIVVEKRLNKVHCEQRTNELKVLLDKIIGNYVGCAIIFDMIMDAKKPLVGHYVLLDLMFFYEKFYETLPDRYESFKARLHALLPEIYDTRYVASSAMRKTLEDRGCKKYNLGRLFTFLESDTRHSVFLRPHIELIKPCEKYGAENLFHEAGYDAYASGVVFIRLAHMQAMLNLPYPNSQALSYSQHIASMKPYVNRLNLFTAFVPYIDLNGVDPMSLRPEWLLFSSRNRFQKLDQVRLIADLSRFGSFDIRPLSSSKTLVAVAAQSTADAMEETLKRSEYYSVRRYRSCMKVGYAKTFALTTSLIAVGVLALAWTWNAVKGKADVRT